VTQIHRKIIRDLLADPALPPLFRFVLSHEPHQLPDRYKKVRAILLHKEGQRRQTRKPVAFRGESSRSSSGIVSQKDAPSTKPADAAALQELLTCST
jgi:hypothetical protein